MRPAASIPNCTFSSALSCGNRLKLWKMKLTERRRNRNSSRRRARVMSCPATLTRPAVGESSAPIRLSIVVLPLPDGPSTTTNSPGSTASVARSSATISWSPTV